jgi:Flp pilus assembly protein protease CpaA
VLSGVARDYFPDWKQFWLSSAVMSAAIMLLVLLFFRSKTMIQAKNRPIPEPEPAAIPGA